MAYIKQTWQTGDIITAEKLNHMEDGIEGVNGYDIIFHFTDGVGLESALGISTERLFSKELTSINTMLIYESTHVQNTTMYIRETLHETTANATYIKFAFDRGNESFTNIGLSNDGRFECESYAGTYTYSDGMYTFTVNDESPK